MGFSSGRASQVARGTQSWKGPLPPPRLSPQLTVGDAMARARRSPSWKRGSFQNPEFLPDLVAIQNLKALADSSVSLSPPLHAMSRPVVTRHGPSDVCKLNTAVHPQLPDLVAIPNLKTSTGSSELLSPPLIIGSAVGSGPSGDCKATKTAYSRKRGLPWFRKVFGCNWEKADRLARRLSSGGGWAGTVQGDRRSFVDVLCQPCDMAGRGRAGGCRNNAGGGERPPIIGGIGSQTTGSSGLGGFGSMHTFGSNFGDQFPASIGMGGQLVSNLSSGLVSTGCDAGLFPDSSTIGFRGGQVQSNSVITNGGGHQGSGGAVQFSVNGGTSGQTAGPGGAFGGQGGFPVVGFGNSRSARMPNIGHGRFGAEAGDVGGSSFRKLQCVTFVRAWIIWRINAR